MKKRREDTAPPPRCGFILLVVLFFSRLQLAASTGMPWFCCDQGR
jgi:hypothetical protein